MNIRYFNPIQSVIYCINCPLRDKHEQIIVPFEYNTENIYDIEVVFIGEAPGEQEALYCQPFYPKAPSGKILRQIIIDLNIKKYGIANIVCCWPFIENNGKRKNRTPDENECKYCIKHLGIFLNKINPNAIVILLGKTAAFSVLGNLKWYVKDYIYYYAITKLNPFWYKCNNELGYNKKYGANFHPRFIASNGGINSEIYKKYLNRMKEILYY